MSKPNRHIPVKMGECKRCSAPIVWAEVETLSGGRSKMPLDPMPYRNEDTRANAIVRTVGGRLHGWIESKAHPYEDGFLRMMPHWATCKPDTLPIGDEQ